MDPLKSPMRRVGVCMSKVCVSSRMAELKRERSWDELESGA